MTIHISARPLARLGIGTAAQRVRSFLASYQDLLREALAGQRRRVVGMLGLDALGAVGRGSVIGMVAYFVALAESGATHVVPVVGLSIGNDVHSVLLLSVSILAIAVISSFAIFRSAELSRGLARALHVRLTGEVLAGFARYRQDVQPGPAYTHQQMMLQVTRNSLQASLSVETMLQTVQPLCYISVASVMLLTLDPWLSLLLLPIGALFVPVVYRLAAEIQGNARDFYDVRAREMGQAVNAVVTELNSGSVAAGGTGSFHGLFERVPPLAAFLDAFDRNQMANDRMMLLTSGIRALALAGAVAVFGAFAIVGERSWAAAVAYVGALVYLLNSLQTLFSLLSSLNRFYPQIAELRQFRERMHASARLAGAEAPAVPEVLRIALDVPEGRRVVVVGRGRPCGYWTPTRLTRLSWSEFIAPLAQAAGEDAATLRGAAFVTARRQFTRGTLRENLAHFTPGLDVDALLAPFASSPAGGQLLQRLDRPVAGGSWDELPEGARALARLLQLQAAGTPVVVADIVLWRRLDEGDRPRLRALFADRFLVSVLDAGELSPDDAAEVVVSASGTALTGIGDAAWFNAERGALAKARQRESEAAVAIDETLIG